MMVEILTGCLNGANCGYEAAPFMADDHLPPDLGQTFMAIDPEKCSGSFLAKVGSLAGVISSQDGARIPGERRFQQRRRNLREGIFIPDDLFRELQQLDVDEDVTVLVGPEGDFSADEVKLALTRGYRSISLGNSRLRTETAGLMAVTMAQITKRKE